MKHQTKTDKRGWRRKWRSNLRSVVSKLEDILESYESFIVGRSPKDGKVTFVDDLPTKKPEKGTSEDLNQGRTPRKIVYDLDKGIRELEDLQKSGPPEDIETTRIRVGGSIEKQIRRMKKERGLAYARYVFVCEQHIARYFPSRIEEYNKLKVNPDYIMFLDEEIYPHYLKTRREKRKDRNGVQDCPPEIIRHRNLILDVLREIEDYMEDESLLKRNEEEGSFLPKEFTPYHKTHGNDLSGDMRKWKRKTERKNRTTD